MLSLRGFALFIFLLCSSQLQAFCGFYVAKADTALFNRASEVVLVRDGDRTVMTMANDFSGNVQDFAVVVPIPTVLQREQIHVADTALIDHLDAYTSPRLVEYFDENPCYSRLMMDMAAPSSAVGRVSELERAEKAQARGVTIEATYTVGEYDILILSAKQSDGLVQWLKENGYRIPEGAEAVVRSYLRQDMRFFVAKVNLEEQAKAGFKSLRPLQIAYEHPRFMLPIRLGTVNADGPQELFVYALSRTGRIETANYRTVRIPSDVNLPPYVKNEFAQFYRDMFQQQTNNNDGRVVFLEYAWDMNWCDPCAADPMSPLQLRELGVFWLDQTGQQAANRMPQATDVFVTRLHVRYDGDRFPEDLMFKETHDRSNFQGRYVLQHPWEGAAECPAAKEYFANELPTRREREIVTLANLTGWSVESIRNRLPRLTQIESVGSTNPTHTDEPWWKRIWK